MSHHIVPGATVRGPFTVFNAAKNQTENLIDKHLIVLAVQGGKAVCAYTGTDADNAFARLPGYIAVPSHVNVQAGWKAAGKFYCDAGQLCLIPVDRLEAVGAVSQGFLRTVTTKVASLKNIRTTTYSAQAEERRTGHVRQMKNQGVY